MNYSEERCETTYTGKLNVAGTELLQWDQQTVSIPLNFLTFYTRVASKLICGLNVMFMAQLNMRAVPWSFLTQSYLGRMESGQEIS